MFWTHPIRFLLAWCAFLDAILLARSNVLGDQISILSSDQAALFARFSVIEQAQTDIRLACFNIDDSIVMKQLADLLGRKARSGVRVRVIIDGLSASYYYNAISYLSQNDIDVQIYHPVGRGRPDWLNGRLHSKLLVVDEKAMIVGSRNIVERHFGLGTLNFVDIDVMVVGNASQAAAKYFDKLWESSDVSRSLGLLENLPSKNLDAVEGPSLYTDPPSGTTRPEQAGQEPMAASCQVEPFEVCVIHDETEGAIIPGKVAQGVFGLVDSSQRSLVIESPYPAFSYELFQKIKAACERGVSVTLITNSLQSTNQVTVFAAYQNQKAALLAMGVKIFEFHGPDHLHAKTMIVDGHLALLGSYNFDARSERLNLELCVLTSNPTAVQMISEALSEHQQQATQISAQTHLEALNEASFMRRLQMRGAQFVVPLFRSGL